MQHCEKIPVMEILQTPCSGNPRPFSRQSQVFAGRAIPKNECKHLVKTNGYAAIIRLSRDGDLRGRAFVRLAELNVALGQYDKARHNLEQSLRAELAPEHRRRALLMLGDLMERHLLNRAGAATAYRQIINEYPATPETELARLRLTALDHE